MTAKEYFKKYDPILYNNENFDVGVCYDIFRAMATEMMAVDANNKKVGDQSFLKLVKKYNDKWNQLVTLFQQAHNGKSVLRLNGFSTMIHHIIKDGKDIKETVIEDGC